MAIRTCWAKRLSDAMPGTAWQLLRISLFLAIFLVMSRGMALAEPAPRAKAPATQSAPPVRRPSTEPARPGEIAELLATIKTGKPDEKAAAATRIARLILNKSISKDDPQVLAALEGLLLEGLGDASFEARGALDCMGPVSLPSALKALRSENHTAKHYGAMLILDLGRWNRGQKELFKPALNELAKHLHDDDKSMPGMAISALAILGADGVAGLIEVIHGPEPEKQIYTPQYRASRILGAIGEPAVKPLCQALQDPDVTTRKYAAWALRGMGPKAAPAVPPLIKALEDSSWDVRTNALAALGSIGRAARQAVDPILAVWRKQQDKSWEDARSTIRALASIGVEARHFDAVLEMVPQTEGSSPYDTSIRQYELARALATIGEPAVLKLAGLLSDKEPANRQIAAWSLGGIGPNAKGAVNELVRALDGNDSQYAADALGAIGPDAKDAAPALVATFASYRWGRSGGRGGGDDMVLYPGIEDYTQPGFRGRLASSEALARIGPAALPAVLEGLKNDNDMIKAGCYDVLWKLAGGDGPGHGSFFGGGPWPARLSDAERKRAMEAVTAAIEKTQDPHSKDWGARALHALEAMEKANQAAPGLVASFATYRWAEKRRSSSGFGRIELPGELESSELEFSPPAGARGSASYDLAMTGPGALPAVLEGLKNDNDMIKAGCCDVLWIMAGGDGSGASAGFGGRSPVLLSEPQRKEALEAVTAAIGKTKDPNARQWAIRALQALGASEELIQRLKESPTRTK